MKHNLLKSVIISVILLMGVSNAWASNGSEGTSITVYTSGELFGSAWDTSKSYIKIHVRRGNDDWMNYATMTETGKTYNGKKIYSYTFKEKWDGAQIYFEHWKTGSGSRTSEYGTDWASTSALNGKLYLGYHENAHRWTTLCYDATIYFLKNRKTSTWTTLNAHAWNDGYSTLTTQWPENTMTKTNKTYNGIAIYSITFNNPPYSKVIFNQGNDTDKSGEQTIPGNEGAIFDYQNNKWITYNYDVTIIFNSNGKGNNPASKTVLKGNAITAPTAPSVTGYSVEGWYKEQACTNKWNFGTAVNADMTLFAKWTPAEYTITYKDQGGSNFSGTHANGHPTTHTYGTATTLKTASKTGYTFEGWYKESACTNKVTSLGATAYTANITLFAKWTEKPKYTVTISSDGNGTVTPNTPQQVGEIPVNITARANDGYKFKNWTKTGNVTITDANNASTTITATGVGSVTANFEKQNRIYLKPAGDTKWDDGSPRYAVYVIDDQSWHDMTKFNDGDGDTGNDIYYCDIKPTYQKVIFCRMNPGNNTNNWDDNNRWTQTEDLTLPDNCNMFDIAKDASKENYDKASGTWMEYNTWHLVGSFNDWTPCGQQFSQQNDGSYTFTRYLTTGTHSFKLVHNATWYGNGGTMTRENSSNWSMSTSENDCQITADYAGDYTFTFNVSTKTLTVRYPILITLGFCDFGTYGIKYNGQSYFSKPNENVTINVPAGAQIEILEGQPLSNAYTGDVIKSKPTKEDIGQTLTINGDITLDDNFKTKTSHVVYLGIPDGLTDWTSGTYGNFLWSWNTKSSFSLIASTRDFKIGNITYYEYTIPAGRHSLCFQRKTGVNDNGTPHKESVYLPFQIPLTDVNCFTLKNEKDDNNRYKGTWGVLPALPGDYRLLYVEQVVEKSKKAGDEWKPVITRKKAHPSDIIRKRTESGVDTVSLHTYKDRTYMANAGGSEYESSNNPEIILQKYLGNDQWQDVECQMVYGPLETLPIMANLPGRKNASPNSNIDDLQYQDGIENIKKDVLNHQDKGNGVWNFVVTQDNNGNASVQWDETHRYTGEYYIRTDNAEGGWDQYTLNGNYMTYSQYAKDHSGFSHYFCRWVETGITPNTKFVIANDYGVAISDTLAKDDYTDEHGNIAHDANIRWSWNMVNNEIARAYIQGTWDVSTSGRNRNLVVNYKPSSSEGAVEDLLDDSGDWIYQKDFTVKVGSHLNSLTAQYPVTTGPTQTFAENLDMLTGNPANDNEYKVRILYDFKINKTLVALVPDNGKQADIAIDVIIERVDQGPATQVQAQVNATRNEGSTVYAVMSFTKDHITGVTGASKYAKQFYWISFPFNVRVSDVFGFGEYGKHWIIQWYDGEERAKYGCWIDSPTYWRFQTDTTNYVLEAGKGYVLTLDLAEMDVFTNTNQVSLYFPSRNTVKTVDGEIIHELNTTTLAPYTCTIQRNDRWIKDSHWHMLGVPSYANKNKTFTQDKVAFFYQYNSANDTYTPTSSGTFNFNSMFSYMVQFAGTINWSQFTFAANGSQGLAAKRNTDNANDKHVLRLELQKNNASVDQTFVQLQAEGATEMFDMNLDLTKMVNSGNNIYSLIPGTESNIEVAANAMPIAETIIPLGVVSAAAGEYTFAMPDGTDGIVVELIDYETNTRTNMLLNEYTVNLGKGTFENRFALHVKPNKTTTSLEDVNTNTTGVKKYLIDGVLYMQKDGVLYDAQGRCVK